MFEAETSESPTPSCCLGSSRNKHSGYRTILSVSSATLAKLEVCLKFFECSAKETTIREEMIEEKTRQALFDFLVDCGQRKYQIIKKMIDKIEKNMKYLEQAAHVNEKRRKKSIWKGFQLLQKKIKGLCRDIDQIRQLQKLSDTKIE